MSGVLGSGLGTGGRGVRVLIAIAGIGISMLALSGQAASGAKISFKDLRGREYKDAQVHRIEPEALVLMTSEGISRVPASALPEDIRKQFGIGQNLPPPPTPTPEIAGPAAAQPETMPAPPTAQQQPGWFEKTEADVVSRIGSGDAQVALIKLQELSRDRNLRGGTNPEGVARVIDLALQVCDAALRSADADTASAALRVAVELDQHSARIGEWLTQFFREIRPLAAKRDFKTIDANIVGLLDGVGLDEMELCRFLRRDMANHCLDSGIKALHAWDLPGAIAAVGTSGRIWDRNPRLRWLLHLKIAVAVLGVPAAIFAIYRTSERLYWWIVE